MIKRLLKKIFKKTFCDHSYQRRIVEIGNIKYVEVCWNCDKLVKIKSTKRFKR